jgi:hypothetical protein
MKTLADEIYLSEALEALSKCVTENQVTEWDSLHCSNEQYMHLPTDSVEKLEKAYRERVQFVLGGLA